MAGLTMPVKSKILGPDGEPIVMQMPVRFDSDAPTGMVFLIAARHNIDGEPEAIESWARRCGVITNVKMPQE